MVYFVLSVTERLCVAVAEPGTRALVWQRRGAGAALPWGGRACSCRGSLGTAWAVHRVGSAVVTVCVCVRGSVCVCVFVSVHRLSTMVA